MNLASELITRNFSVLSGELCIDAVRISMIVREFGTPLFVYDARILDRNWQILRSAFPSDFAISYSVKANPNPYILKHFLDKGCGLEIASPGELHIALTAGCHPGKLMFAGPGKTESDLRAALTQRVGEIHIESLLEAQRLSAISLCLGTRATVALRVNPSATAQGGAMQMGGKAAQFGVDEEQLDAVIEKVLKLPGLDLRGLHFYLGTQILDHEIVVRQYTHALGIVKRIVGRCRQPLNTVDFGGGLGIPYFSGEGALDMQKLTGELRKLRDDARTDAAFDGIQFVVEPGRYLVGEAGVYVARVNDIKFSRGKKYAIIDGGMHHHLAASGNLGQVIKRNFPIAVINKLEAENLERVDIVGPLCTPLDTLARDIELPNLEPNDLIGILQSGAYARTASPHHFLSYPSPSEVLIRDQQPYLIRRRGTVDDLLRDVPSQCSPA